MVLGVPALFAVLPMRQRYSCFGLVPILRNFVQRFLFLYNNLSVDLVSLSKTFSLEIQNAKKKVLSIL